ncbi:hypothetical protein [Nocardioides aurantiacus]|uniref:Uncharacterized protein n=1 Tax=Nocardioides aurantiacus TaxID=86796 RepID=A0A3N2CWC7_9ACTN|nr:hypothetical protein [Nocardioides aurantiacus]ROR91709.1 hypothetical protein EDD33_2584 [Nocardioides aurantiacus]ROR91793.1 hypothetical protein EDD33_2668 [Nocardioides aurantiacus]
MTPTSERKPLGFLYDELGDDMDAAYAERRKHKPGTPEYVAADEKIESVYAALRVLNIEAKAL